MKSLTGFCFLSCIDCNALMAAVSELKRTIVVMNYLLYSVPLEFHQLVVTASLKRIQPIRRFDSG